jgi:hypothetical protein
MQQPRTRGSRSTAAGNYLREPISGAPLPAVILAALIFDWAATPSAGAARIFFGLAALGALLILRAPRWVCYFVLWLILLAYTSLWVFTIANGPQDSQSDRDEAVEIATQAFLDGRNPWSQTTQLNTPISTGPASILLSLPAVWLFHRINELTFAFYLLFFGYLCAVDIGHRNNSFLLLGLVFIAGWLGFRHTLYWSLDELYYPFVVLAAGWVFIERDWLVAAGGCLAFAICARLSYGFPVFAFVCWYVNSHHYSRRGLSRLLLGVFLGSSLIIAPFVVTGGADFFRHNPLTTTGGLLLATAWPDTNDIFRALNLASGMLGSTAASAVKVALSLGGIYLLSRMYRTQLHPFWIISLGALAANAMVFRAGLYQDYALFFVVPAFMGIAHSERGA